MKQSLVWYGLNHVANSNNPGLRNWFWNIKLKSPRPGKEYSLLFLECEESEDKVKTDKVKKSREMLKELKEERMPIKIDINKILSYSVEWCKDQG